MDPNASLFEIRTLYAKIMRESVDMDSTWDAQQDRNTDCERLAELCECLDQWISRGGFLPREWRS